MALCGDMTQLNETLVPWEKRSIVTHDGCWGLEQVQVYTHLCGCGFRSLLLYADPGNISVKRTQCYAPLICLHWTKQEDIQLPSCGILDRMLALWNQSRDMLCNSVGGCPAVQALPFTHIYTVMGLLPPWRQNKDPLPNQVKKKT